MISPGMAVPPPAPVFKFFETGPPAPDMDFLNERIRIPSSVKLVNIVKDSNPKDSVGVKKVPFSTVPSGPIAEVGLAMLEGALKYGRHNYRSIGVRTSVYYDACLRHLNAFWEGQDTDPDSGLPHIIKATACLIVLRDSQLMGNVVDDRPPSYPDNWQQELNQKASDLINKYPEPKKAFTKE